METPPSLSAWLAGRTLPLVLVLGVILGTPRAEARRGDISPVAGKGVTVEASHGVKAAAADLGAVKVKVRVSTKEGFLFLDVTVWNRSSRPIPIEATHLVLKSRGEEVESMAADQYASQAYEAVTPYPIDDKGRIVSDDKRNNRRIKAFTPGAGTSGQSMAEMMTEEEWEDGAPADRMRVTRELLALRNDPFTVGATIAPGQSIHGRRVFQRTNVEPPLVVKFEHPVGRMTVRFERER